MPELEGVKSWSRGSRRRLRGASLRLGLLDRLGLVARALLVSALSTTIPSSALTTSLTITLFLFKGWLIWSALYCAELIGILRGSLLALPLLPDQGCGSPDLSEVQSLDVIFLVHYLGNAIHGGRELCHKDHGLEVFRDLQTHSNDMGEMGNNFVNAEGGVLMVRHLSFDHSSKLKVCGNDSRFPV